MRGGARDKTGARVYAKLLVFSMILASFAAFTPTAGAVVSGDLGIISGIEPIEGATYDRDTSFISPKVQIKNDLFSSHSPRQISWQICPGDHTAQIACSGGTSEGYSSTSSVSGFQTVNVSFVNMYQPSLTGIHTIFFMFTDNDADPSDDMISYTFNVAAPLRDMTLNQINFDENEVYNSDTSYPITAEFYRRSWQSGDNATFGWELYNEKIYADTMSAGGLHSCAILDEGSLECWGKNNFGQLGLGNTASQNNPATLSLGEGRTASSISAGGNHSCAILDDSSVKCWGSNNNGQLGIGNNVMQTSPKSVSFGGNTADSIAIGDTHSCAILDNGSLNCWGRNIEGQLGFGNFTSRNTPLWVNLTDNHTATQITAGYRHTCAILDNGSVSCWGWNLHGQLGLGVPDIWINTPSWVDLGAGRTATSISAGVAHTCAILDDESVKCWGLNDDGQLGLGHFNSENVPVSVVLSDGQTANSIEVGDAHSCVITNFDALNCWGSNEEGQLGTGDLVSSDSSQNITTNLPGQVNTVQLGGGHTCVVLDDQMSACTGRNQDGQLGIGNFTQQVTFSSIDYGAGRLIVATEQQTSFPPPATDQNWVSALPDVVAPYTGRFLLRAGLISSDGDMNDWNNMGTMMIYVNDDTDVWIESIEPARGSGQVIQVGDQNNSLYPLGDDSIRVTVGNIGSMYVNTSFTLSIFDMNGTLLDGPNPCDVVMDPQESASCIFSMPVSGDLVLRAEFPVGLDELDVNPSDNWYEVEVSSRHKPAYPTISYPPEGSRFDSGDSILFIGQVSQYSAMPMNFTWRLNYEEVIGYGQIINVSLPMGEWLVTLTTRDSQGQVETGIRNVRIQNRISMAYSPWVIGGESVLDEQVNYVFNEPEYPPAGFDYTMVREAGLSTLRIIDFDIEPSLATVTDPGIVFTDSWISLTGMIPDELDRESIQLFRMESKTTTAISELLFPSMYEINSENDTLHIYDTDYTNGIYLIAGDLIPATVGLENLTTVQLPGGTLRVEWEPTGDLDNPYFGGWRVYRRLSFPFFWPFENNSQFQSVIGTEVSDIEPHGTFWNDPAPLPDGSCVSYLVMAIDRQGMPDYSHGGAVGWNGNSVEWQCGDATPPFVEVQNMNHVVSFNNSSGQNIHHVDISWIWPDYGDEDNITWQLYRVDLIPSDLTWIEPIETGMWGEPGTVGTFHQKEDRFRDGIEKEHIYHYILVPMDDVGNIDYSPLQGNIETVDIGNQFWDHNSDLIPPPPPEDPPPYGVEWFGEVLDYWGIGAFRTSAMMAFAIVLLNIVMIPVIINQTRGVRRRIKRDKKMHQRRQEMLDAEDMADDLEDMFN